MAKQTFTTGQVLTAAQMTSLQQTAMLGGAANAKVASYVLVAADAGDAITMSNASATTITVNTGLFAAGDIVTIINLGAGICTITAGTATVATSGSLALAQNQGGVLRFTSASESIFFQFATPASGDIEGVTAGVGISGGGTSGTVTVTNSMATAIDAKGDLIAGTGADAFARLGVGTNGQALLANSATATGLEWATPASGGMTLISTTTLSGSSTVISSIPSTYNDLQLVIRNVDNDTDGRQLYLRFNNDSTANRHQDLNTNTGTNSFFGTFVQIGSDLDDVAVTNLFVIDFPDYKNTTTWKFCKINSINPDSTTPTDWRGRNTMGMYNQIGAISSLTILPSSGNFSAGTALLYGVK